VFWVRKCGRSPCWLRFPNSPDGDGLRSSPLINTNSALDALRLLISFANALHNDI
jgi:hypothetical protein